MSFVTNFVLACELSERFPSPPKPLTSVSDAAGGNKGFEMALYASAYNYADIPAWLNWFRGHKWQGSANFLIQTHDEPIQVLTGNWYD